MTSKSARLPLSDSSGYMQLTLMGVLACTLLALGFLLILQSPVQAFVGKNASCSASGCHVNTNASSAFNVSINGTPGTSVTVAAGGTFEIDYTFTNMANGYGVGAEIAVPSGWTVGRGTANNPTVTGGWNSAWDATDGVTAGWTGGYSTSGEFAGSPVGYSINYAGTSWDTGNRDSAYDDGTAGKDLDGTAEKMGVDARITVPAGTPAGTYTVMVLGIGHDASRKAHDEQTITVTVSSGISQTITVTSPAPANAPYNSQFTVAATASSGLPVSYSSGSTSICTNSGATFTMVSGTGTCIVQYDQAGGSGYSAAPRVTSNTTATKISQAAVSVTAPANAYYGQTGLSASASGGSGTGAYSYSAGSSTACTVNATNGALTITSGSGTCDITATKAADTNYTVSATSNTASVAIAKASQATVSVTAPANAYYGQTGLSASASGGSGTGAFSYSAGASTACTVNAANGALTITSGSGSCSITATKAADTNYNISATSNTASVTISKATPTVSAWPTAATITYGQTLANSALTGGTASTPGAFAFTAPATAPNAGTAPQGVTFTPTDTTNYNNATGSVSVTVDKANQTITFTALANKTFGDASFTLSATGGASGNPVTFANSNPAVATVDGTTVTIVGAGITTITASQAGTTNYNAATDVFQALTVDKANQTIIFAALPAKNVGDADFAPGATASSTLAITYTSSNTAVATIVGGLIHIVGPGATDITASQAGNTNYNAATDVIQPLTISASGTPTLNVTISGTGSVNSTPSGISCTSGTCSADFTSGQSVDLLATPAWNYDFSGWSGACSGNNTTCTVTVNGLTDVSATFVPKQLVKLPGGYYPSLQDAYAAASNNDIMQLRDQVFSENLDFNRPVQLTIDGGWNADYTAVTGSTTINGSVTVIDGGITVNNMIIQ